MEIDPEKGIQRIIFGEQTYVLVLENVYEGLLRQLDSYHSALEIQRTRVDSSSNVVQTLLEGTLTRQQVDEVLRAPTFGKRLGLLREYRGMRQDRLAEEAAVSQTMISKLENDELKRPSFESVHRILHALGVPDIVTYPLLKAPPSASKQRLDLIAERLNQVDIGDALTEEADDALTEES